MFDSLEQKKLVELQEIAGKLAIKGYKYMRKGDLIQAILNGKDAEAKPENDLSEKTKRKRIATSNDAPSETKKTTQETSDQGETPNKNSEIPSAKNSRPERKEKHHGDNQNNNNNKHHKINGNGKMNFREPDYEFEGIIETEGVLEIMPDGY